MAGIKKKYIVFTAKILFAAVMMYVIVKDVNFREIIRAIQHPNNRICIYAGFFLLVPNLYMQWFRWHYLIGLLKKNISPKETLFSFLGGMAGGFITPGRIGEVSRYLFLPAVDPLQAAGMVILDKAYAAVPIIAVGIWGLVLMLMYIFSYNIFLSIPLVTAAVLISFMAVLLFSRPCWIRTIIYNISLIFPYRDKAKRFMKCFDLLSIVHARNMLLYSLILYSIYIAQFILFAHAFQPMVLTTSLTATVTTMFVKTLLPISFADIGIREGAAVYFFTQFNVTKVTAFNSSILLFAVNVLVPSVLGLVVIIFYRNTRRETQ